MTPLASILWLANLLVDTAGQLAFKAAASSADGHHGANSWKKMFMNRWIWAGVFCYIFEFFLWLAFLSIVPLSLGVLVGSLSIFTVTIGGRVLFGERLTPSRVIGTSLIALGVALTGWS